MGLLDIFKKDKEDKSVEKSENSRDIVACSEAMLAEAQIDIASVNTVKLPIEQLGLLGAGVASMLPSLRTIQQSITTNDGNLFRWVTALQSGKLNTQHHLFNRQVIFF